jgi:hypothetical protein
MALLLVSTAITSVLWSIRGVAAAGVTEFQGGRAGLPVAPVAFMMLVLFTAGTGIFIDAPSSNASGGFILAGFRFCWFWHYVTTCTVSRTIITHMSIIR